MNFAVKSASDYEKKNDEAHDAGNEAGIVPVSLLTCLPASRPNLPLLITQKKLNVLYGSKFKKGFLIYPIIK